MLTYLKARLLERSTWMDIGAGIGAAAALPAPWSFVGFAVCVVKAMIPDGPVLPPAK